MPITDEELAILRRLDERGVRTVEELDAKLGSPTTDGGLAPAKRQAYYADRLGVAQGRKLVRLECKACDFSGLARARPQGDGEVGARCPACESYHDLGRIGEVKLLSDAQR